jgi:hypothetical protein
MEGKASLDIFYQDCIGLGRSAQRKAEFLKIYNIITTILIIVAGAVISVFAEPTQSVQQGAILVLAISISVLKTGSSIFRLEQRAVVYKQISVKLRRLTRTLTKIQMKGGQINEKKLNNLYREFDELDLSLFSNGSIGRLFSHRESPEISDPLENGIEDNSQEGTTEIRISTA